jgi:hypothetical protein
MMTCKNCGGNHRPGRCPPRKENRSTRQKEKRTAEAPPPMPLRGTPVDGTGKTPASAPSRNAQ